jgi:hypothetical protein
MEFKNNPSNLYYKLSFKLRRKLKKVKGYYEIY